MVEISDYDSAIGKEGIFESNLNDEQYKAVTSGDGPVLVLAAAGTGKTRTLVYRVAYLVKKGVSPSNILLLTFTNKAAREMLQRAKELVGPEIGGIWAGTFHHMANRILRRSANLIGYDLSYIILDRDDSLKLIKRCVHERGLSDSEFPKPAVLMSLFGAVSNTGKKLTNLISARFSNCDVNREGIIQVWHDYMRQKMEMSAMDFDDLLSRCLELLSNNEELLAEYRHKFRHILVDEYQDTNIVQSRIIDLLAGKRSNLFVVGDDFQSIYSWRGADYRNMLSFASRYKGAQIYKLETNYRSSPEVLDVANACIAVNTDQFQKTLRSTRESQSRPMVVRIRDGFEQAVYIAERIQALLRAGYRRSDIAVLDRSHVHAMDLQIHLTKIGIPYLITSGVRFFEQAHIKDVCSLLRLLHNFRDRPAFSRLLIMFPKVGDVTAGKIIKAMPEDGDICDESIRRVIGEKIPKAAVKSWRDVSDVIEMVVEEGLESNPGEIVNRFVNVWYEDFCRLTYEDADRRLEDIGELVVNMSQHSDLHSFLNDIALMTNLEASDNKAVDSRDYLRLSTIHQAKGLEWPVVIVPWLVDGMFPSSRSMEESSDAEAEERRLFYVAVTRARDFVFICIPELRRKRDGGVMSLKSSRFIREIPVALLDEQIPGFI